MGASSMATSDCPMACIALPPFLLILWSVATGFRVCAAVLRR